MRSQAYSPFSHLQSDQVSRSKETQNLFNQCSSNLISESPSSPVWLRSKFFPCSASHQIKGNGYHLPLQLVDPTAGRDESTHCDPGNPALHQVAEATKSSIWYARLYFKHSFMATSM